MTIQSCKSRLYLKLGVVTALPRSQLSPRIQNAMLERKKEPMGRCCDGSGVMPLLERVGLGSPTSEDGLLDAVKCGS